MQSDLTLYDFLNKLSNPPAELMINIIIKLILFINPEIINCTNSDIIKGRLIDNDIPDISNIVDSLKYQIIEKYWSEKQVFRVMFESLIGTNNPTDVIYQYTCHLST